MSAREDLENALLREHSRQRELTARHELDELRREQADELRALYAGDYELALQALRRDDSGDLIALIRAGWDADAIEQWAWERYG